MKVNRIFVVLVSQEAHEGDEKWAPIWGGAGAVRVAALDRDRCMVPVTYEAMERLLRGDHAPPASFWDQVPPLEEIAQDERGRSRIEAAPD